jgi:hypothetical protein
MLQPHTVRNDPFCSHCGYSLKGLTESSKCPECGKPLVEVLTRSSQFPQYGKRWRSRARLWGYPVLDIAMGPSGTELRGHAKGIIAIGDIATGGIAIGGIARGIVAIGGMAIGGFTVGGLSCGFVTALGGMAIGSVAVGGMAVGVLAFGGMAVGILALGGGTVGVHTLSGRGYSSVRARDLFSHLPALAAVDLLLLLLTAGSLGAAALLKGGRDGWKQEPEEP